MRQETLQAKIRLQETIKTMLTDFEHEHNVTIRHVDIDFENNDIDVLVIV